MPSSKSPLCNLFVLKGITMDITKLMAGVQLDSINGLATSLFVRKSQCLVSVPMKQCTSD
jgi:hypothetical protein